jgi:hypothetical protein
MRPPAGTAWARYQAEATRHLRPCPPSSMGGEARELSGQQQARSGRGCGIILQYRHRDSRQRKLVWKPCRTRSCPDCGPWLRREKLRRYQDKLDGWPLWLVTVDDDRWPTLARRLRRHGAQHLRIPAAAGCSVVVTTIAVGEPVTDLAATLAELLDAQPLDARRVTSSDAWKLSGQATRDDDQDQDQAEPEWVPEGLVTVTMDRAVELARELGVYLGPVTVTVGEAHLLGFPDDREVWQRWKRWAGLVQDLPQPRRRRYLTAA